MSKNNTGMAQTLFRIGRMLSTDRRVSVNYIPYTMIYYYSCKIETKEVMEQIEEQRVVLREINAECEMD